MARLEIRDSLLERLREIASQESRPLDLVVETAIEQYVSAVDLEEKSSGTNNLLQSLAKLSAEEGWKSGRSDVSENFDDIVGDIITEEFLKRRMDSDGD